MSCPVNQCNRTNMYVDSQGIMRANKDLVKHYDAEPLPTLSGKPERITAINVRIKEDEAKLISNLEPKAGNSAIIGEAEVTIPDNSTPGEGEGEAEGTIPDNGNDVEYDDDGEPGTPVE